MKANPVMYYDTMLRYHLHIDPEKLSDEEWAVQIKQLEDYRKKEAKQQSNA